MDLEKTVLKARVDNPIIDIQAIENDIKNRDKEFDSQDKLGLAKSDENKLKQNSNEQPSDSSDHYCWICHSEGDLICCDFCPRTYHLKCIGLSANPLGEWSCVECSSIKKAELEKKLLNKISMEKLKIMLRNALTRIKYHGTEIFQKPVDPKTNPEYEEYVIYPMDLSVIEKKIESEEYKCLEAVLADMRWIVHNCAVYNGIYHNLTGVTKSIIRMLKHEINEMDVCPDCYLNSIDQTNKDWFCLPCRIPHPLIWAKLRGFPHWPAKALRIVDGQIDVRFFGAHDRAWIPIEKCMWLSKQAPSVPYHKKNELIPSLVELEKHINKLIETFGDFTYAPIRMQVDPDKQFSFIKKFKDINCLQVILDLTKAIERERNTKQNSDAESMSFKSETGKKRSKSVHGKKPRSKRPKHDNDDLNRMLLSRNARMQAAASELNDENSNSMNSFCSSTENLLSSFVFNSNANSETANTTISNNINNISSSSNSKSETACDTTANNINKSNNSNNNTNNKKDSKLRLSINSLKSLNSTSSISNESSIEIESEQLNENEEEEKMDSASEQQLNIEKESRKRKPMHIDEQIKRAKNSPTEETNANSTRGKSTNVAKTNDAIQGLISPESKRPEVQRLNLEEIIRVCREKLELNGVNAFLNKPATTNEVNSNLQSARRASNTNPGTPIVTPIMRTQINSERFSKTSSSSANMSTTPVNVVVKAQQSQSQQILDNSHISSKETTPVIDVSKQNSSVDVSPCTRVDERRLSSLSDEKDKSEIEKLRVEYERKMKEYKQGVDLKLKEALNEFAKEKVKLKQQYEKKIEETKRKVWCANCLKEAIYYCCWNTSYCDEKCQRAHWDKHMNECLRGQLP